MSLSKKITSTLFVFLFITFTGLLAYAQDTLDKMDGINKQVEAVSLDLKKSIEQLSSLALNGQGAQSGEQMIDQTIAKIESLEANIGDQSELSVAIDQAIKQIELQEKRLSEKLSTARPDIKKELLRLKNTYRDEKDKIYSSKSVVISFKRKLKEHVTYLKERKELLGFELDINRTVNARKSIEQVVSGLKQLNSEIESLNKTSPVESPE